MVDRIMTIIPVSLFVVGLLGCFVSHGQLEANKTILGHTDSDAPFIKKHVDQNSFRDMLRFTVSVSKREWRSGTVGSATLRVENSSNHDIEIRGPGAFRLYKRFSKNARDQFYSSSALPESTTTSSTTSVHHTWIKCPRGGHLDLKIDLGAIKWGRVIGAERPNQDLMQIVPRGNYQLFFTFIVGKSANVEIPESTIFESNKVNVAIK